MIALANEYRLETAWHLDAPCEVVYEAVLRSLLWPHWWQGVEHVESRAPGNAAGIGAVRRYIWKGALPYRIVFDACAERIDPLVLIEASVTGDLEGTGRWLFGNEDDVTVVRYQWRVRTTRKWMNLVAPIARPLFTANHRKLMEAGGVGLARLLGVPSVEVEHGDLNTHSACAAPGDAGLILPRKDGQDTIR